ncbi:MAG: RNA-binding S4 domain-containing protein [Anaerolineae bacterium]|jgi:ribosome-associated protein|nr:RNA-binding S4 domain-containing protein [Chloroflexota bacterium]
MDERPFIRMDDFLKLVGLVKSGGEAKYLIQHGQVTLNGEVETRRSKKLYAGDVVALGEYEATVELQD